MSPSCQQWLPVYQGVLFPDFCYCIAVALQYCYIYSSTVYATYIVNMQIKFVYIVNNTNFSYIWRRVESKEKVCRSVKDLLFSIVMMTSNTKPLREEKRVFL